MESFTEGWYVKKAAEKRDKEQAVIEAAKAIMLLPAPLLSTACVEWANLEDAVEALVALDSEEG